MQALLTAIENDQAIVTVTIDTMDPMAPFFKIIFKNIINAIDPNDDEEESDNTKAAQHYKAITIESSAGIENNFNFTVTIPIEIFDASLSKIFEQGGLGLGSVKVKELIAEKNSLLEKILASQLAKSLTMDDDMPQEKVPASDATDSLPHLPGYYR